MADFNEIYVADFETETATKEKTYVTAFSLVSLSLTDIHVGTSMEQFINRLKKLPHLKIFYMHNLKFDGKFLLYYLLGQGYEFTTERKLMKNEFATLIDGTGTWYNIKFNLNGRTIEVRDSLKKLPLKVIQIAKAFNTCCLKTDGWDYHKHREEDAPITKDETEYVTNDSMIVAEALAQQYSNGLDSMTIGADALSDFKKRIGGKKQFRSLFPEVMKDVDNFIRLSYKGGWTYKNPKVYEIKSGVVYDVNSLYPFIMYERDLPYGQPEYYTGNYVPDEEYPLYVQHIRVTLSLKDKHLPMLQIKKNFRFADNEYIECIDEPTEIYITSVDLELLQEQYDIWTIDYIDGYKLKSYKGFFKTYIDYWMNIKMTTTGGKRQLAKLMLNSLYGKFGTALGCTHKEPYMDDNGFVKFNNVDDEDKESMYIPMASFITSYARQYTINAAQKNYDRFCYADTDSIHLSGDEDGKNIVIDSKALGAWKLELKFDFAKYIRQKTYVEVENITVEEYNNIKREADNTGDYDRFDELRKVNENEYHRYTMKCAGMPDNIKNKVSYDNFKVGLVADGKLVAKNIRGGVLLTSTTFTMK